MNSIKSRIGGVIPAVPTPFDKEGHVAERPLRQLTDFMIARGVNCLFVCGGDGEGLKMRTQERKKVAEIVVDQTKRRIPVIVHVGSASVETAIDLARHAEKTGADALASVQPYYYSVDDEGLVEFYRRICLSTSLPFLVYNNPWRTHNKITLETMKELAKLPNVIGCKDTSGDIRYTLSVCRDLKDFIVIVGEEALVYSACFFNDLSGTISGISSSCPEPYVQAFKAFKEGDRDRVRKAQFKLITLEDLFEQVGYAAALKEALRIRNICEPGPMTPPFHELTQENKMILRKGLQGLGLAS
jgi:dihydrodipicolinate synthase/N-acetylneuraminate lyase